MRTVLVSIVVFSSLAAFGCSASSPPSDALGSSAEELVGGRAGAVYTLNNDAGDNEVLVFRRAADGSLVRAASYSTGGKGSGDGLGSQGAVTLSRDRHWLFAVNAGSNELSTFFVAGETLYLVDVVATGGQRPISVTEHDGLVYVLHAGKGANGITGFAQRADGSLGAIAGSTRPLSAADVGPAEIAFSHGGGTLIVTEKGADKIDTFAVDGHGVASAPTTRASNGRTPFGFAVTSRGEIVVSEAFGGAPGAGAASSYEIENGALELVTGSSTSGEAAPCWVALARGERTAYVTNTASGSITAYAVAHDGTLTLAAARAADTGAGSKPEDIALSKSDRFVYVLESGTSSIGAFKVDASGGLTAASTIGGLPASAVGLAAQ